MSGNVSKFNKMYYVPVMYHSLLNNNIYNDVKNELENSLLRTKNNYYEKREMYIKDNKIEKTVEYIEYKSCLIRLIIVEYAYYNPDKLGKYLLDKIIDKWNKSINMNEKIKNQIYDRALNNIIKYENTINNIEEIMMLISLQILEHYFFT
jgi:hypothetical protein